LTRFDDKAPKKIGVYDAGGVYYCVFVQYTGRNADFEGESSFVQASKSVL
jgi:hypothetical protein